MIYSIVVLTAILIILPYLTGTLLADREDGGLIPYVYGYLIQWALFYVIAVYAIVTGNTLLFITKWFVVGASGGACIGVISFIRGLAKKERKPAAKLSRNEMIYLACFLGIVLFQIYKTLFFAYGDGDDAYYMAIAQDVSQTKNLYINNAYTGQHVGVNYRYALAPLPVWLAMVANLGKIQVTTLSFLIVPVALLIITYVIYNQIAKELFKEDREKRFLFMLFISVFVTFANVSTSTAETFLLTRARQGKEGLANIVIPVLFYVFVKLINRSGLENKKRIIDAKTFWLVIATCFCSALMSVFGNFLALVMLFLLFVYLLIKHRNIIDLLLVMVMTIPNMSAALLYFLLRRDI